MYMYNMYMLNMYMLKCDKNNDLIAGISHSAGRRLALHYGGAGSCASLP
jgi:predicted GIY-YIG superfamily endonuclease